MPSYDNSVADLARELTDGLEEGELRVFLRHDLEVRIGQAGTPESIAAARNRLAREGASKGKGRKFWWIAWSVLMVLWLAAAVMEGTRSLIVRSSMKHKVPKLLVCLGRLPGKAAPVGGQQLHSPGTQVTLETPV